MSGKLVLRRLISLIGPGVVISAKASFGGWLSVCCPERLNLPASQLDG